MPNKSISIKIDKEILEEFKNIVDSIYEIKYTIFIKHFLYYSNFPDIKAIFKFRFGINYIDLLPEDKNKITTFKVSIEEPQKITNSLNNISTYLREVITIFVENKDKFLALFNISDWTISYEKPNHNHEFNIPIFLQNNSIGKTHKLLAQDFIYLDEHVNKYNNQLIDMLGYRQFSDFRYEQELLNKYANLKYRDLNKPIQTQISLSKIDYKEENYLDIIRLYIKRAELVLIYIYKVIISNQKRISNFYQNLKKQIILEYQKNIKYFNVEISLEDFILHVLYDENQLVQFSITGEIELNKNTSNKIHKNIKFLK